ncbi:unnamed protein product [Phytophthora lilii]|uniref:Unnamed protein product n=1 Tax=Phytophthora lilii TaxID=2077276 RepID=A0A9W6TJR6_9STRA|nr:unnamed protein product [Phytophthora lilii]
MEEAQQMSREVYFQFMDKTTRLPLPDTFVDAVDLPEDASLIRFRNAIKVQCPNTLANVDAANLRVYANRTTYDDKNGQSLRASASVDDLGKDEDCALIVVVPQRPSGGAIVSVVSPDENERSF